MAGYDAIVVGLGAMGSAAAYHLARRGRRVLGLDARPPGHTEGSSHGESRIIRLAYYEHPDYVPLLRRAYELWAALAAEAGEGLLRPTGALFVGRPDGELIAGSLACARRHDLPHELLDSAGIHRRYPALWPDDAEAGLFEPQAGILLADRCVAAQRRLAVAHGAELRDGTRVRRWTADEGGVAVETDAGRFEAGALVLAAGPWLGALLADLVPPLRAERIPVFSFAPRESSDLFAPGRFPVYMWDKGAPGLFYGFPHLALPGLKTGRHHNDDWCDPDTVDRAPNAHDEGLVRAFLARHIPALDGALADAYICLYTDTPDYHFLLDRHPAHPNVCFAGGFSGHGFKFAPVIGEILADLATTGRATPAADFLGGARLGLGAPGGRVAS